MAQIIPVGYVSTVITITGPEYTDGYSLITMGNVNPGGGGASDAAVAVANALDGSGIRPFLANTNAITQVECHTDTTSGLATTTIVGTRSTASITSNCAVLVEKRTSVRGRRAQGRNFWPGLLNEATVSVSGMIDETQFNDLQDLFDEIHTALVTEGVQPVILQGDQGISPPLAVPPEVNRFVVDPQISSQRRRMRR